MAISYIYILKLLNKIGFDVEKLLLVELLNTVICHYHSPGCFGLKIRTFFINDLEIKFTPDIDFA